MRNMGIILTALVLLGGMQAKAEIIECGFSSLKAKDLYQNGPEVKQVLRDSFGTGFRLDKNQNTIQIMKGETFYTPIKIERTSKTKNFTAYIFRLKNGSKYTYRIDNYNNTKVVITPQGNYVPLEANGTCRPLNVRRSQPKNSTRRLSIEQEIQSELNRLGCNVGATDGSIGPASRRGLKQFAKANNAFSYDVSVFFNLDFLKLLREKKPGFCNP